MGKYFVEEGGGGEGHSANSKKIVLKKKILSLLQRYMPSGK